MPKSRSLRLCSLPQVATNTLISRCFRSLYFRHRTGSGAGVHDEGAGCRCRRYGDVAPGELELHAATEGDAEKRGLDVPVADSVRRLETLLVADADVCEEPLGDSEGRSQAAA